VLLEQLLKVIHSPMEILNGDFDRIIKLIDVHLLEKDGFENMKKFGGLNSRCVCIYMYICLYLFMYVCMYVCMCIYM
jgi:hypothetical protein